MRTYACFSSGFCIYWCQKQPWRHEIHTIEVNISLEKKKKKMFWNEKRAVISSFMKKSLLFSVFGELVFTDGLLFNACFCGQRRYEPFIHSCKQKGRKYCFLSILLQVGLSSAWAESHSQCTAATERGALLLAASRKKKERIGICRRKKTARLVLTTAS